MKRPIVILAALAFLLTACWDMEPVTAAPNPARITPSRPPPIFSPTPILVTPTPAGSASITPSLPPIVTPALTFIHGTLPAPTSTSTASPTPISSVTPAPLAVQLLGCDTGFDITHRMGEVTNAYAAIVNASGPDLTGICATLSSADEGRPHPDKTICIPSLPGGFQVTLKLTIDTTFQVNTIVDVAVASNEGAFASTGGLACADIGAFKPAPETIGVLQPVQ